MNAVGRRINRFHRAPAKRGITLVESAMSVLIVGMLIVASLRSLTASFRTNQYTQNRARATLLAEQLLVELSLQSWRDPQGPSSADTIGRDTGDPTSVTRRDQLDDQDDFDNWLEMPLANRDGTALTGVASTWRRSVLVDNISASDAITVLGDSAGVGLRRVTVIVDDGSTELARIAVLLSKTESTLRTASDQQRGVPNVPDGS